MPFVCFGPTPMMKKAAYLNKSAARALLSRRWWHRCLPSDLFIIPIALKKLIE
jgi:hypothetical protein